MQERSIRVFVSSTFRDMQAEREELVKRVFPRLRRLCEERGVAWSEVDLRWGVTDEQKAEGAVLPICLAEIDRSRPYFLGLLGGRYGWVPEELPAGLTDRLPWLADLPGTSVTELEVLHGVLQDPGAAGHAFFHVLHPAPDTGSDEPPEHRQRQDDLKERVRRSGHPHAVYADPEELGRQVLAELTALVDRLFPAGNVPDPVVRETEAHLAFGRARAAGSIARPSVTARLGEHADGTAPPLVVRGDEGSDLTPLVATWLDSRTASHPGEVAVRHHVGATSDAADWRTLASRVVAALAPAAGPLPEDAAGCRAALFAALSTGAPDGRPVLVVVDGADLLVDADGAPDLTWLPPELPPAVRVVVTTSGHRPVDEALRRGWPVLDVPPLTEAERASYVTTFLARWAKGLDPAHVETIVRSPRTGNVLYLRTVLDELRQHGDHFTLGEVIHHYLAAESVDDLLELVLARYEEDFERDRPGLVGDAFRAVWAARRGLTEPELLELLGDGEPLPSAVWSPLVIAAEAGLITRSGRIGFATEAHRRAVAGRYLPGPEAERGAHARLASYFAAQPLGPRVVEELPWQQLAAGDLDGLVATLSRLDFLDVAYPLAPDDLRRLWARAEESGRSAADAYRAVVDAPAEHDAQAWPVARLVTDAGHPAEALTLHRYLVGSYRTQAADSGTGSRAHARLRASLLNLGAALQAQGALDEAVASYREAADLARPAEDERVLQAALGNLGLSLRTQGDLEGAATALRESLELARVLDDPAAVQAALGDLAGALRALGSYDDALALLDEQEALARSVGDRQGLGLALAGKAAVGSDRGDPLATLARIVEWRVDATERGDRTSQVEALVTESTTLRQLGRLPEGTQRAAESEALARRLSDEPLLARVLDVQARTAIDEGRWEDARRAATEALLTARGAGATQVAVLALGSLGMAQRELGDLAGSRVSHTEELTLATRLGERAAVAVAQVNLAAVDIVGHDLPAALGRYADAEPVLRSLGLAATLVPLLGNRAQVHEALGDLDSAIADLVDCGDQLATTGGDGQRVQVLTRAVELMYRSGRQVEAEPVWASLAEACTRTGDEAGLQRALGEHALLLVGRGERASAVPLLDRQEEICRRTGDRVGLAACVGNRAIVLQQEGDLAGALACLDEQLALSRASGNAQGVLFATANRGEVLGGLGRTAEALAALQEARTMATQWGMVPVVQQLDQMIARLSS